MSDVTRYNQRFSVRIKQQTGGWRIVSYAPQLAEALEAAKGRREYVWAVFEGPTKILDSREWVPGQDWAGTRKRFTLRLINLRTGRWVLHDYFPTFRAALEATLVQPIHDCIWSVWDGRRKVLDERGWSGDIDFEVEEFGSGVR